MTTKVYFHFRTISTYSDANNFVQANITSIPAVYTRAQNTCLHNLGVRNHNFQFDQYGAWGVRIQTSLTRKVQLQQSYYCPEQSSNDHYQQIRKETSVYISSSYLLETESFQKYLCIYSELRVYFLFLSSVGTSWNGPGPRKRRSEQKVSGN